MYHSLNMVSRAKPFRSHHIRYIVYGRSTGILMKLSLSWPLMCVADLLTNQKWMGFDYILLFRTSIFFNRESVVWHLDDMNAHAGPLHPCCESLKRFCSSSKCGPRPNVFNTQAVLSNMCCKPPSITDWDRSIDHALPPDNLSVNPVGIIWIRSYWMSVPVFITRIPEIVEVVEVLYGTLTAYERAACSPVPTCPWAKRYV